MSNTKVVSRKKQLETQLNKILPDIIKKIKEGDLSQQDKFASVILPYVSLLLTKHSAVVECKESEAGWLVMKILNKLKNIDIKRPILGYIVNCVNNHCIDLIRKKNRKKYTVDKDYLKDKYKKETFIDLDLDNYISETFDKDLSEIIELKYIENKTTRQVADITGQPMVSINRKLREIEKIAYND